MLTPTEWVIYTAVASYSACFMAIQPLHLFYVESLTSSETGSTSSSSSSSSFATLKTIMAIAQLIGSLYVGTLTDRMGGKRALLLALGSSALSYALTAYASSMLLLYLAQAPTVFQHGVLAARSYMTSTLSPKDRAVVLGRLSSAYAGGMLVGPALGGYISQHWGLPATGIVATLLSLATFLLVLAALPNSVPTVEVGGGGGVVVLSTVDSTSPTSKTASLGEDSTSMSPSSSSSSSSSSMVAAPLPPSPLHHLHQQQQQPGYLDLLAVPGVPWALCIKGVFSLSSTLFQFIFTLLAVRSWGFGAGDMGGVMALIGGCMGVANLVLVPLLREAKEGGVLVGSALVLAASLALLPLAPSKAALYALCAPQAAAATVWGVVQGALMSKLSPSHLQGSLNALDMCLRSGTSIVAPWLGTHILEVWGDAGGCLIPAALMVACAGMQEMVGGGGGLRGVFLFLGGGGQQLQQQQQQHQHQQQQQQHTSSGEEEDKGNREGGGGGHSSSLSQGEGDELLEKVKPRHKKPYHTIA